MDGKPFLIRGGELGNSTASNGAYLRPFWPRFAELNLNTVLAPVYWELVEPEEGRFDFSVLDQVIEQARSNKMRLVLLWFGSWKNTSGWSPAASRSSACGSISIDRGAAVQSNNPEEVPPLHAHQGREANARERQPLALAALNHLLEQVKPRADARRQLERVETVALVRVPDRSLGFEVEPTASPSPPGR